MEFNEIWASLSTSELFWLTATLVCYAFAERFYRWTHWNSLANPVAITIGLVILLLVITRTPYKTYFDGAQFIHFCWAQPPSL